MRTYRLLVVLSAALALGAAACGGSDGSPAPAATASPTAAGEGTIATASEGELGTVVVDADGMTLYLFEQDENGQSSCDGACAASWPPVTVEGSPVAGAGIQAGELGTTERPDGSTQVTYAGHPLYRYAGDSGPGDTNGQGLDDFGAEWYAVSEDGEAVEKTSGDGMYGGGY
jgi:predicted lipoprotein with Yx(FWY)xxD motif